MIPRNTLLARRIVRRVFAAVPELPALSTKQIFDTAMTKFPDEQDPDPPRRMIPLLPKKLRNSYEFKHKKQPPQPDLTKEDLYYIHPMHSLRQIFSSHTNIPHRHVHRLLKRHV
jgi:hypothetical protein